MMRLALAGYMVDGPYLRLYFYFVQLTVCEIKPVPQYLGHSSAHHEPEAACQKNSHCTTNIHYGLSPVRTRTARLASVSLSPGSKEDSNGINQTLPHIATIYYETASLLAL